MQTNQVHNSIKKLGRKPKPVLTIALDCGSISQSTQSERGGVATVTAELVRELAHVDKRNRYKLYSFAGVDKKLVASFDGRATNIVLPRVGFKSTWMRLHFLASRPDVFVATSQAWVKSSVPTLGIVYDVAFFQFRSMYTNFAKLAQNTSELVRHAKHIITISESSKEDILSAYKLHYKKVSVYYPGIGSQFRQGGQKVVDVTPYFLYVGTLKPTKNITTILKGFARLLEKMPVKYRFVLIGKNEMPKELAKTIQEFSLTRHVVFKGYVKSSDLPKYYRGAVGLVSPSLYEGFGLPLVEAMASGIPVIAAKNSVMNEVVGKAGLLVDATKPDDIANAMGKLVSDKSLRVKLIKLGLKQSKKYSWKLFAKGVLDAVYTYCV